MKKFFLAMIVALVMLCGGTALAAPDGENFYAAPDPEHFFGEALIQTKAYNYVMHFNEDPREMFDAYVSLLQRDYYMYPVMAYDDDFMLSKIGCGDAGMQVAYISGEDGYRLDFYISPLIQLKELERYHAMWAALWTYAKDQRADITLPDPGYYFGKEYFINGVDIPFDAYPKAEFDAYTALLTGKYGLEIVDAYADAAKNRAYCYMTVPGVDRSLVFVSAHDNGGVYGLEVTFGSGIFLNEIDVYTPQADGASGEIAWDDGRMIADPGDFLGYEIAVTDILDMTDYDYGGNYFERYYAEIPMEDILKYIDALDASPYFALCGTSDSSHAAYRVMNFLYTGPDADLAALCRASHKNKRTCDLYVLIDYRSREQSAFRVVSYPGFTVNSADNVPEPEPDPDSDGKERCIFCDKGRCKECGGEGFVYRYAAYGKDWREKTDCSSCFNGRCSFCDGTGWR